MRINLDNGNIVLWDEGAHYAHIINEQDLELDVFSFAWEKDKATELDFTNALQRWLSEE